MSIDVPIVNLAELVLEVPGNRVIISLEYVCEGLSHHYFPFSKLYIYMVTLVLLISQT